MTTTMTSYSIELPSTAFSALRKPPAEFIQEMKYTPDILEEELRHERIA
ncbi:hypothetical protein QUF58_06515 [Anaerolineales bacterium HSG24]|nr:hypothetical protein [Anaerolineales bacterium HSG24]